MAEKENQEVPYKVKMNMGNRAYTLETLLVRIEENNFSQQH